MLQSAPPVLRGLERPSRRAFGDPEDEAEGQVVGEKESLRFVHVGSSLISESVGSASDQEITV
jgi:hypothetical protein